MTYSAQQVVVLAVLVVCIVVLGVIVARTLVRAMGDYLHWVRRGKRARRVNCAQCGKNPRLPGDEFCSEACANEAEWSWAIR